MTSWDWVTWATAQLSRLGPSSVSRKRVTSTVHVQGQAWTAQNPCVHACVCSRRGDEVLALENSGVCRQDRVNTTPARGQVGLSR